MVSARMAIDSLLPVIDRLPLIGGFRDEAARMIRKLSEPPKGFGDVDYLEPKGDPGLFGPDSMAWRVNANGGTMFIGGIAAVLLELAEPRVRSGVWDHTDFRTDPVGRMRRTGMAAMVTTYGPVAEVEKVTARVRRMHDAVTGTTPEGEPYRANNPELLDWVHVTAVYGFLRAYVRYAEPTLGRADQDRYYAESAKAAGYYGVTRVPASVDEVRQTLHAMRPRLRHHPIVDEFLGLVSNTPVLSRAALPVQRLLVQAAIDVLPEWARKILELETGQPLRIAARPLVRTIVALSSALATDGIPQDACRRMRLPADHLVH